MDGSCSLNFKKSWAGRRRARGTAIPRGSLRPLRGGTKRADCRTAPGAVSRRGQRK